MRFLRKEITILAIGVFIVCSQAIVFANTDEIEIYSDTYTFSGSNHDVEVILTVNKKILSIGDPLVVKISIIWNDEALHFRILPPELRLINLTLKNISEKSGRLPRKGETVMSHSVIMQLVATNSGKARIESIPIRIQNVEADYIRVRHIPETRFIVRSVTPLRPIIVFVCIILFMIFSVLIVFIINNKKTESIPIEEKYISILYELQKEKNAKEFCQKVMKLLKSYLLEKYAVNVESTDDIEDSSLEEKDKEKIQSLLDMEQTCMYATISDNHNEIANIANKVHAFLIDKKNNASV